MRFIGLDAGSVSVKIVVLDENATKLGSHYVRHKGHPVKVTLELLRAMMGGRINSPLLHNNPPILPLIKWGEGGFENFSLSITGSAGKLIASILNIKPVNELVAQAYSTSKLFPHIRTIIELGGEDSKLIQLGENSIKEFSMNSVCAAGTGSFLDQQAERLRLTIEEFSELSLRSKTPPRIAGRCSVFAKSDMIHLQQIATPMEDIVSGLCFAVARNFKGSILRGRKIKYPVSFHGGVAANRGMVMAFQSVFELNDLFIPPDFFFMGAIGAALRDMDEGRTNLFDIRRLEDFVKSEKPSEAGHRSLIIEGDGFLERHLTESRMQDIESGNHESCTVHHELGLQTPSAERIPAYLGIDIGSISTNLAVIDENGHLLSKRYLMTAGQPIEAVKQGLKEIEEEVGDKVEIMGVGTTGSGRYMIADYVGADIVKNEITAQATAAAFIDKNVDTIFEIGGQDSKYISLKDGAIVDFEMNKACAAGTGSFLEEQAEKLNISIKNEFAELAFSAENPCRLGERCTVFMENSLMSNLHRGVNKNNLLAGLAYSIVQNYINRVVAGKPVGENIFFQGGVAFNKSVVAAFEKYLNKKITVPPHHDVTGAIGMALIARDYMRIEGIGTRRHEEINSHQFTLLGPHTGGFAEDNGSPVATDSPIHHVTSFKGFELSKRPYSISSFECRGCPNVCEINRVKIEGEDGYLFYGGRCEKYDVRKKSRKNIEDLFAFREDGLRVANNQRSAVEYQKKHKIGLPYIFLFQDLLPFWSTFLNELGFDVVVSPKTNRNIINLGLETILSESCFPVKVAHGHVKHLIDNEVRTILLPSFVSLNKTTDYIDKGSPCPYTQTIPYVIKASFRDFKINLIQPVIDFSRGDEYFLQEIKKSLKEFRFPISKLRTTFTKAKNAQKRFNKQIQDKGKTILSSIDKPTIVIVGRAYNSFDKGMNLQIPEKLATLNVLSIPMDFLPLDEIDISDKWAHMYWQSGKRILQAARFIKNHRFLYPIYISNFNCGPDSFLLEYFREEIGNKPFLYLEIDEHSADAGALTRCEAFLDSIKISQSQKKQSEKTRLNHLKSTVAKKKIYIPRMCDHAYGLEAAFKFCGIEAEVLPEPDRKTIELGRKYVYGKQCYPCVITIGEMLKKSFSSDFEPNNSLFFMPSGTGPCRFGQYNIFQRLVLDRCGLSNVQVFSPIQDVTFYSDLGIAGEDFVKKSWQGIIAIEMLTKCVHETRPYERENGLTNSIYDKYLKKIVGALKEKNGSLQNVLKQMRYDFETVPKHSLRKPRIGIIGEIFVRSNRFANEHLIEKVESLEGEVWLSPPEEWIFYVNHISLRHALKKKNISAITKLFLKNFFQKRIEHNYGKLFRDYLKTLHEPTTAEILRKASPYIHSTFEGETILSVGKSIDLIEKGISGIINVMPFGCMPGTIVTALMRAISRDYNIPCISIPYDGTEAPSTTLQLEAFMDQAKARAESKGGSR